MENAYKKMILLDLLSKMQIIFMDYPDSKVDGTEIDPDFAVAQEIEEVHVGFSQRGFENMLHF